MPMTLLRAVAVLLAALAAAPDALAQTGQQKYTQWCQGCHGSPSNNKDGVLGGKDWTIIKLAMDTKPTMTADLRPAYNAGLLTDDDFMLIAGYLQTFQGGVTSQLAMPATVNFGTVNVGASSSVLSRNVSSVGNASVQITSVTSTNPLEFPIVSTTCEPGEFVNPLSSCAIGLQFTPASTGTRSGQITVVSNGIGSPQSFAVTGTGQSAAPPPPAALTVPSSLNLGSQPIGVLSAGTTLTVTNGGGSAVSVTSMLTNSVSEFPIVGTTCGTVNAGGSCTVVVAFRPPVAGARSGTLTITSNGAGSPHQVTLFGNGTAAAQANKVEVVEYYHAAFGHYFMTADPGEIAGLDAGAYNFAFTRTGRTFFAWSGPAAGTVPVCRFFTVTFAPKSSHFYTGNDAECEGLKAHNKDWQYENVAVHIAAPVAGACPLGTVPVYRMYNSGQTGAPNHRFTTDFLLYQEFTTTKGWTQESIGFCAPP
ncbi:hypothetical protein BURK1_03248 [Burkholderiales bacterium]|nr:hypothetical protein BURK1_03248 [Burkholderiales bacterium]